MAVEDSIAIRCVVAVAVEVAILAVVTQPDAVEPATAIAAVVLAPAGYLFSYRRRGHANVLLKVLVSVALLAALGQFMASARSATTVDQARIPLATLFLWVQVLHAFDVPRRRDLAFSMVSSMILMAEAGSLSLSSTFLVFLVPWMGLGRSVVVAVLAPSPRSGRDADLGPETDASRRDPAPGAGVLRADIGGDRPVRCLARLPCDAAAAGDVRANTAVLVGGSGHAAGGLRWRRAEPRSGRSWRRRRGLQCRWVSGLQRRRRPAVARATLRRDRVPSARATGRVVAGGGVRHLRRRHVDDRRRSHDEPGGHRRISAGSIRHPRAEHGRDRRRRSDDPDLLHRGGTAKRLVRRQFDRSRLLPRGGSQGRWGGFRQNADPAGRGPHLLRRVAASRPGPAFAGRGRRAGPRSSCRRTCSCRPRCPTASEGSLARSPRRRAPRTHG